MLPAQVKKEFRGEILSFLYGIHPLAISQVSIYQTYFQYYKNRQDFQASRRKRICK